MDTLTQQRNAFIFHGTQGSPEGNWFPWLKARLEAKGIPVHIPQLPTPTGQTVENWMRAIEDRLPEINPYTLLIGHSSGANFILHLLECLPHPVGYVALTGTVMQETGILDIDLLNTTFFRHSFDWRKIRSNAPVVRIFHSDNDPYTPMPHAEKVSQGLGVPVRIIPGGGHLNAEWGFLSFEALEDDITQTLEKCPDA